MEIIITKQALNDFEKIKKIPSLFNRVQNLLDLIQQNPFINPPSYEKLKGFESVYSRRINIKHRLVYEVIEKQQIIKILAMWTHYDNL